MISYKWKVYLFFIIPFLLILFPSSSLPSHLFLQPLFWCFLPLPLPLPPSSASSFFFSPFPLFSSPLFLPSCLFCLSSFLSFPLLLFHPLVSVHYQIIFIETKYTFSSLVKNKPSDQKVMWQKCSFSHSTIKRTCAGQKNAFQHWCM